LIQPSLEFGTADGLLPAALFYQRPEFGAAGKANLLLVHPLHTHDQRDGTVITSENDTILPHLGKAGIERRILDSEYPQGVSSHPRISSWNWNEDDGPGYDDPIIVADHSQSKEGIPMIRGVVQDGLIRPLDPLPPDWAEGCMVIVEEAEPSTSDDLEEWYQELQRLGPAQYDPGERDQIRAIWAEADAQAKEFVRREMESR
jgi:hypothetical protein